jgi:hypothetical protein
MMNLGKDVEDSVSLKAVPSIWVEGLRKLMKTLSHN